MLIDSVCFVTGPNLSLNLRLELIAGDLEILILLHTPPELRRSAEVACKPKRGFARDAAPTLYNLRNPVGGNMQLFRELVHAHAERL